MLTAASQGHGRKVMSSVIDCAALRRTVKRCQSDVQKDERRIKGVESQLRGAKDQGEITELKKELESLRTDIVQAEALEEETQAQINEHCGGS
jgi:predicted  nucleic acid-binding Zn-ribbon protein